jgi:soluble lytic murein transglycosylase
MASGRAKQTSGRGSLLRGLLVAGVVIAAAGAGFLLSGQFERGYRELKLPLRHDDIIRQQARDKNLDPALIAAVIYRESGFRPRESKAGALGLMQLLPDTADFIAGKTGGSKFETADLASPQINIAYGSWYLRYLMDRYDNHEVSALAAYNAGEGRVDQWVRDQGRDGGGLTQVDEIPFPETREYVSDVLRARDEYRREYARELRAG